MHSRELDKGNRAAQARIAAAAELLAGNVGIDPELVAALSAYHSRDPEANRLRKQEAVADLLEALAAGASKGENPITITEDADGEAPSDTAPAPAAPAPVRNRGRRPRKGAK